MRHSGTSALLVLACIAALLWAPPSRAAEQPKPNVLVVLSYHIGMPWTGNITRGLQDRLGDHAELVILQLDVKRFPPAGREAEMLAQLAAKTAVCRPRLVITIDDYAYRLLLQHRDRLLPATPVVFGGVNYWDGQRPPGVTGVVEAIDLPATLRLMSRLQPAARRWVIVNDPSETGAANRKALDQALPSVPHPPLLWLGHGTYAETESELVRLSPSGDAVLLLSWNLDAAGKARSYAETLARTKDICPAPLYGVWDFYFGNGIVGGAILDGQTHGREIGDLALRVLGGTSPDRIPVTEHCLSTLKIDHRELLRAGLSPALVPPETEVAFRPHSFWHLHGGIIAATAVVLLLQTVTISWLLAAIRRQRHARDRLRESENSLRLTLDSIEEAVIVADPAGRVTRLNPAAEKLTGINAADATGTPLASLLPISDPKSNQPFPLPTLQTLARAHDQFIPARALLKSRSGPESTVVLTAARMLDDHGNERGLVLVLRDITAQQHLEAQLYQAQKMESIGQLAGGIAHDFNNILAVIIGHGELLRDNLARHPEALEDLEMMMRGAQRATDLVQQILAFSRKTRNEKSPLHLQSIAKEALKFLRSTVPSTIELASRISPDLPLVLADPTQIHQIILNLCTNAAHALKNAPYGRIEVRLEAMHADTDFAARHPDLREGEYVCISVSDTGHGMDEKTLAQIFEPLFTTKAKGEGTGLGLSVVHGIVKAHHGAILVHSRPQEGTVFHIYLPALSIAKAATDTPPPLAPAGRGEHIVFVDDEPTLCAAARRLAEELGYRVTSFANPLHALRHLQENPAACDILVTDLTMPGGTGIHLADSAHRLNPALPVVLTTGFAADLEDDTLRGHGIRKLLLKPFTKLSFALALHEALHAKPGTTAPHS